MLLKWGVAWHELRWLPGLEFIMSDLHFEKQDPKEDSDEESYSKAMQIIKFHSRTAASATQSCRRKLKRYFDSHPNGSFIHPCIHVPSPACNQSIENRYIKRSIVKLSPSKKPRPLIRRSCPLQRRISWRACRRCVRVVCHPTLPWRSPRLARVLVCLLHRRSSSAENH